jgi:hypothetical protein
MWSNIVGKGHHPPLVYTERGRRSTALRTSKGGNVGKEVENTETNLDDVASAGDKKRKASPRVCKAKRTPPLQHEFPVGTPLLMYFYHWEVDMTVSKEITTGEDYNGTITNVYEDNDEGETVYEVTYDTPDKAVREYSVGPIRTAVKDHKGLSRLLKYRRPLPPPAERSITNLSTGLPTPDLPVGPSLAESHDSGESVSNELTITDLSNKLTIMQKEIDLLKV